MTHTIATIARPMLLADPPEAVSIKVNWGEIRFEDVHFGYGRESGKQHVEEYLNVKAVWIKTA